LYLIHDVNLTLPLLALPIQSYTLQRQIVKNKKGGDDTTPVNEADRGATEAAEQSRTEEGFVNPDVTLTDKKDLVQNANTSDLEKGKGGS